jgi:hypothetical protein
LNEFEGFGEFLDVAQVAAFDLGIVKRIQVVNGPDAMAVLEQAFTNVGTNEPGAAGDKEIHPKR